ncbi:winged helix-turn-helix transcriptional regulator [Bradyrhizobium brasilense]|uniref:winged helix-turn-helix transcriptional regulator n=1 Tax=Bradyrhizobium brasilense TaxID=1419277 RepID=UPI0024B1A9FE|nr:winged helix-turn-helix transcriptional regulator [Bradyrhizobium australafricanum]WFU36830.1 winged helix-turn-helix transcriptional regulator [Bradyrhizobium australafricanum]
MPAWSAEDEKRLLQLVRDPGLTQRQIAQKLGRSEAAVTIRLALIRRRIIEELKHRLMR